MYSQGLFIKPRRSIKIKIGRSYKNAMDHHLRRYSEEVLDAIIVAKLRYCYGFFARLCHDHHQRSSALRCYHHGTCWASHHCPMHYEWAASNSNC